MKSEEELRQMRDTMHKEALNPKSNSKKQQSALHWFHCLNWILQDEDEYIKERIKKVL